MEREFARVSPGYELQAWVDKLPPGAPEGVVEDDWDYTAYCAKPFALKAALDSGADVAILLDAAFFPIRPIQPLVDHIAETGYYLCDNGATIGEWASDRALKRLEVDRGRAFGMCEVSSYCVGITSREFRDYTTLNMGLVDWWCVTAKMRGVFEGAHTAGFHAEQDKRNPGIVSVDPRVKGHRHDQTALSIGAHVFGMTKFVARPRFTAYEGSENETTVLVNRGM